MKVALVSPMMSKFRSGNIRIPHGILSLCAVVKNSKCQCDILDFNMHDYGVDILKKYDLVGLSVLTGQLPHATYLANTIGKNTKTVWGGIHCLFDPLSILRSYPDTFVISGEGETPLANLIDYLSGNRLDIDSIAGLSYSRDGEFKIKKPFFLKDINVLPDVNYYDLPYLEKYLDIDLFHFKRKMRTLESVTGRGCSWNCSFCINSIFRKHKAFHRSKNFDKIRREIAKPIDDFKIEVLLPIDDDFFAKKKLVSDWSSYTREKGLLWRGDCRYNYLGKPGLMAEDIKGLANSGLYEVAMGIEAGDEGMRNRLLNKVIKDVDIIKGVSVLNESKTGIAVNTSFISYFPGDTQENRIKMMRLMDFLSKNLNIIFSGPQVYRIYPGSKLSNIEYKNVTNDLRYYLDNLTFEGWLKSAVKQNEDELLFFSIVLSQFFNMRFNILERSENNEVTKTACKKESLLVRLIMSVLMVTVTIRLNTNYWRFFVEPRYIGKLYRLIRRIGRLFKEVSLKLNSGNVIPKSCN